jgi:hypothetical protein
MPIRRLCMDIIKKIPPDELLLLDKSMPGFANSMAVFQDFKMDIYDAMASVSSLG